MSYFDDVAAQWIGDRFSDRHPLFAEREEELRRGAIGRAVSKRMNEALGSRAVGPFHGFHVDRDDTGLVWRCVRA